MNTHFGIAELMAYVQTTRLTRSLCSSALSGLYDGTCECPKMLLYMLRSSLEDQHPDLPTSTEI